MLTNEAPKVTSKTPLPASHPSAPNTTPTPDSTLRANPFPKVTDPICRLPLPTLFYQLEAVHLGDLLRLWVRPVAKAISSLGFSRTVKGAPDTPNWCALPAGKPLRQLSWFRGDPPLIRKDNSFRSLCRRLQVLLRCRLPCDLFRNINLIPFRSAAPKRTLTELTCSLGSTNPSPTAVHLEPFPTSVFKVLIWIFATTTKICTRGCFTRPHGPCCFTTPTPSYSSAQTSYADGRVWVTRLSAIHFQG